MDDERLKNGGSVLTTEYFDRLLEQILFLHQFCPPLFLLRPKQIYLDSLYI